MREAIQARGFRGRSWTRGSGIARSGTPLAGLYGPPVDPCGMDWARTDEEAEERYRYWRDNDPFPWIPPALLGSQAVRAYVRATAMVHPFAGKDDGKGNLIKPASYEIAPGKAFFRFDDDGNLEKLDLESEGSTRLLKLPRNSITFVSTAETLRLPNYIAARFNLRIKHVHRGILLGTGPLVDPGYDLPILIPLHNLTDQDYFIGLDEGLIWVEFTKAYPSPGTLLWEHREAAALPGSTRKGFERYLTAASGGIPIRSSISEAVTGAKRFAEEADGRIAGLSQKLNTIGVVGILALAITVASLLIPVLDLIRSAGSDINGMRTDLEELRARLEAVENRSETASGRGGPDRR